MKSRRRPRILYVTRDCPGALSYGGQIRALNIGRLLQRVGAVTPVVVATEGCSERELDATRGLFGTACALTPRPTPVAGVWARLRCELDPRYMNTVGYAVGPGDTAKVRELMAEHDLAWVHRVEVADMLQVWNWGRSVLDVDDLASSLQAAITGGASGLAWLHAVRRRALWRRREAHTLERFRAAAVCSERDRLSLGGDPRIHVVPNGFTAPETAVPRKRGFTRLGFIGLIQYPLNLDGLRWFLSTVWPTIRERIPEAELRIVGRGSDSPEAPSGPGTTGLGWVPDVAEEMATWSASIVPVRQGAGTRIKIAEAFARRVPVVSTGIGAFGYPVQHERELLLADAPGAFAASCVRLLRDPDLGDRLSECGAKLFETSYSWDAIAPAVERAVEAGLRAS